MVRQHKVLIEERDRVWRTKNIHGHLALQACRTIFIIVYTICVCMCVPDCLIILFCLNHRGHQSIPYRELWSAALSCLYFTMQPNISQRTKSLSDKSRHLSLSFIRTDVPALWWGRLCQRRGWQPYLEALGIFVALFSFIRPVLYPKHQKRKQILGVWYLYLYVWKIFSQRYAGFK